MTKKKLTGQILNTHVWNTWQGSEG